MDLIAFVTAILYSSILMGELSRYRYNPNRKNINTDVVNKRKDGVLIFFAALMPALLVGCRGVSVGSDTKGTAYLFYQNYIVGDKIPSELVYWCIGKIGHFFIPSYNGMLIAVALSTLLFAFYSFAEYRYYFNPGLATFIYLCLFIAPMCNILRQSLAATIFMYSIKYIHKRRLIKYIICILLAGMVHTSAFLLVLIYPLYHIAINTRFKVLRIMVIAVAIMSPYWITYIYHYISSTSLFSDYSKYDALFSERKIATYNFTIRYQIYILIGIFLLKVFLQKQWKDFIGKNNIYIFWLFPILEAMGILCTGNMKWAFRIMYYFTIGYPLLNSYLCANFGGKYRKIYSLMTCFAFLYYFVVFHYLWGNDAIFPYVLCF